MFGGGREDVLPDELNRLCLNILAVKPELFGRVAHRFPLERQIKESAETQR